MSKTNNDIASLFKHLGTSSEHYQEIGRSNEARESEARWPLLASIHESATSAPAVVPSVSSATPSGQPARDLVKNSEPASVAPLAPIAEVSSRSEPSITLPALLHDAHSVAAQAEAQPQTAEAPARKAEFIAPRPKSLVTVASRREAPLVHEAIAPLAAHDTGKSATPIENMFARLAKPKTAPVAEQPTTFVEPAPLAPEPKRSLFERLIRK